MVSYKFKIIDFEELIPQKEASLNLVIRTE
jgi:hypothetical protein